MSGDYRRKVPAGSVLFRPNDECRSFVIVHEGVIRVSLNAASGRELVLYRVAPGQICTQTFVCITQRRTYAAEGVAETDCEVSLIPPEEFDRRMRADDAFRTSVYAAVADRFSDFEHTVQTLAFTGLDARVAGALLARADAHGLVSATHEQIATEIGSAREAVSRQLGLFAREGVVSLSRGRVEILDRDRLSRICVPFA